METINILNNHGTIHIYITMETIHIYITMEVTKIYTTNITRKSRMCTHIKYQSYNLEEQITKAQ